MNVVIEVDGVWTLRVGAAEGRVRVDWYEYGSPHHGGRRTPGLTAVVALRLAAAIEAVAAVANEGVES